MHCQQPAPRHSPLGRTWALRVAPVDVRKASHQCANSCSSPAGPPDWSVDACTGNGRGMVARWGHRLKSTRQKGGGFAPLQTGCIRGQAVVLALAGAPSTPPQGGDGNLLLSKKKKEQIKDWNDMRLVRVRSNYNTCRCATSTAVQTIRQVAGVPFRGSPVNLVLQLSAGVILELA